MSHMTSPAGCTLATCPDFRRHLKARYEWAKARHFVSPSVRTKHAMLLAQDAIIGEAITRANEREIVYQPKEVAA